MPETDNNGGVLRFCPRCSENAFLQDGRKIVCTVCGFGLYLNTAAAVAGLIFGPDGRLMVIRRNKEPRKGFLDLPGGFVDYAESGEAALAREVFEELGAVVEGIEYFRSIPNTYLYGDVLYHTLDIFYTCRLKEGQTVCPNDEIMEVMHRFPADIGDDEIAFSSMRRLIGGLRGG